MVADHVNRRRPGPSLDRRPRLGSPPGPWEPEFTVLVVGPSAAGVALLAGGVLLGALSTTGCSEVEVRVAAASASRTNGAGKLVVSALERCQLPVPAASALDRHLVEKAHVVLVTDEEVRSGLAHWPTRSYNAIAEPPELFTLYGTRPVVGEVDWRARADICLPDFDEETSWSEVMDMVARLREPAARIASVVGAVLTNQGFADPRLSRRGVAGRPASGQWRGRGW